MFEEAINQASIESEGQPDPFQSRLLEYVSSSKHSLDRNPKHETIHNSSPADAGTDPHASVPSDLADRSSEGGGGAAQLSGSPWDSDPDGVEGGGAAGLSGPPLNSSDHDSPSSEDIGVGAAGLSGPPLDPASIPSGLESMVPGKFLGVVVDHIDSKNLSGDHLITYLTTLNRQISHLQAQYYSTIREVTHRTDPGWGESDEKFELANAEIAAALSLTRRAADYEAGLAADLVERFPLVLRALDRGDIDIRRARTIIRGIAHLDDETAHSVEAEILRTAPHLTTGQIAARLRRLSLEANPKDAQDRYLAAIEERRLYTEMTVNGSVNIMGFDLPADSVAAASQRINLLAERARSKDDPRTMDQIRADVFLDLLVGPEVSGRAPRGSVEIQVELSTLANLREKPAELAGMGPIVAEISRQVVAEQVNGKWSYVVTHNGRPVATGTLRRRPTTAQHRQISANYQTCIFPGCRMPASQSDIDHRKEWAKGGRTDVDNLAPLCRYHHRVKDEGGWQLERLPDGDHRWTSRLGHHYTTSGRSP